jgi:hypothetical protein
VAIVDVVAAVAVAAAVVVVAVVVVLDVVALVVVVAACLENERKSAEDKVGEDGDGDAAAVEIGLDAADDDEAMDAEPAFAVDDKTQMHQQLVSFLLLLLPQHFHHFDCCFDYFGC